MYDKSVSDALNAYEKMADLQVSLGVVNTPVLFIVGLPRCGSTFLGDTVYRGYEALNLEENSVLTNFFKEITRRLTSRERM